MLQKERYLKSMFVMYFDVRCYSYNGLPGIEFTVQKREIENNIEVKKSLSPL